MEAEITWSDQFSNGPTINLYFDTPILMADMRWRDRTEDSWFSARHKDFSWLRSFVHCDENPNGRFTPEMFMEDGSIITPKGGWLSNRGAIANVMNEWVFEVTIRQMDWTTGLAGYWIDLNIARHLIAALSDNKCDLEWDSRMGWFEIPKNEIFREKGRTPCDWMGSLEKVYS